MWTGIGAVKLTIFHLFLLHTSVKAEIRELVVARPTAVQCELSAHDTEKK